MNDFTAADLFYTYPKAVSPGDDARNRGQPDSSLLNRQEQYEVLYYLNLLMKGGWTKEQVKKAEKLLHKAPGNLRSHAHLTQWIVDNWNTPV